MVGSDHGHETISHGVNVVDWLGSNGYGALRESGQLSFATQGTAALLYAIGEAERVVPDVIEKLKREPWVGGIATGGELERLGIAPEGGLVAGISLARKPEPNDFGVAGQRWAAFNGSEFKGLGFGQHGGWGPDETRPFLILDYPGGKPERWAERTSLIDIAPTILTFLGLPADGMEGKAIAWG